MRPIFHQGRLIAFAINLAHWADIGGAVPGSYVPSATECYLEGLRIAPHEDAAVGDDPSNPDIGGEGAQVTA